MKSMMEIVLEQYEADKYLPDYDEEDALTKDMTLTVGHIIANPNFDCNCNVLVFEDDGEDEPTLYDGDGMATDIPADILVMPVTYISIRGGKLAIGTEYHEE